MIKGDKFMEKCMHDSFNDIKEFAHSMGMSPEEYAVSLHNKNKAMKSMLLENGSEFKEFVNDFHKLLDELMVYKETDAKNSSFEHYSLMKRLAELMLITSKDPMLLAQLHQHYSEDYLISSENKLK